MHVSTMAVIVDRVMANAWLRPGISVSERRLKNIELIIVTMRINIRSVKLSLLESFFGFS